VNYIDLKYINLISPRLDKFKKKTQNTFNFRCPFCGDSQKSKSKARGWFIEKQGKSFYYCHNCSISKTIYDFLKHIDVSVANEYYFEKFKSGKVKEKPTFKFEKPVFKTRVKNILEEKAESLANLSQKNLAVKYVIARKIPQEQTIKLYYIDDFSKLDPGSKLKDERFVIPYYNREGGLTGFTGRTLHQSGIRYTNVKYSDEQMFYGLHDADLERDVYIVEGAIDSMFIENSIAVTNANLSRISSVVDKEKCILIPDKEPRNRVIVDNIYRYIELGYRVCLIPHLLQGKDINEYIFNGLKLNDLKQVIDSNTWTGMVAKLKLSEWKKI